MSNIKTATSFNDNLIAILPRLRAYAILLTRDRALADDIVQDAAMRALKNQAQFQEGTNFSAWMHRIVRNCFINEWRVKQRTPVSVDAMTVELHGTNASAEDVILLHELSKALNDLPSEQAEALILVCAGGLSYEEAAKVQGTALGTLKSRLFRAKAYLAEVVDYDGPAPVTQQDSNAASNIIARKLGVPGITLSGVRTNGVKEDSATKPRRTAQLRQRPFDTDDNQPR